MIHISCDDEADATRSLARIYCVDVSLINDVAMGNWPKFILDSKESCQNLFDSPYIPSLMAQHLRANPNWDIGDVAYYHRTAYNGSADWFQEGLLASHEAANAFLDKIAKIVPFDSKDRAIALANIKDRECGEGVGSGGPYAFDVLDNARHADRAGMDYSLPEFFAGNAWAGKYGVCHAAPILESLRKKMKPVVVKFSGRSSDPDAYITNLWQYVFRARRGEPMCPTSHFRLTFSGAGKTVTADRIIQLIDLGDVIACSDSHD
jgi:hypothetical protein